MKKTMGIVALLVALTMGTTNCNSGPHQLRKSWEDVTDNLYSQNAWLHGALLQDILPIYPFVSVIMWVGDVLFVNPWYFWTNDAWTNRGTTLIHDEPRYGRLRNAFTGGYRGTGRDKWDFPDLR